MTQVVTHIDAGKFVMIPHPVLDSGVSSRAIHVYASIRRHADNTTGQAWVSRETLAEYLGSSRAAIVDPYLKELVEARLITSQPRYVSKRDARDWSFTKDAVHTKQSSNLFTIVDIAAGREGYGKADPKGTEKRTPGVRKSGHELDPLNFTPGTREEHTARENASQPDDVVENLCVLLHAEMHRNWTAREEWLRGDEPEITNGWRASFDKLRRDGVPPAVIEQVIHYSQTGSPYWAERIESMDQFFSKFRTMAKQVRGNQADQADRLQQHASADPNAPALSRKASVAEIKQHTEIAREKAKQAAREARAAAAA